MADRSKLRLADQDSDQDDPFAELTKIMGFDPRVPVKRSEAEALQKLSTPAPADSFAIDLERELLGEFALDEHMPAAPQTTARAPETDVQDVFDDFETAGDEDDGSAAQAAPDRETLAEDDFAAADFDALDFDLVIEEATDRTARDVLADTDDEWRSEARATGQIDRQDMDDAGFETAFAESLDDEFDGWEPDVGETAVEELAEEPVRPSSLDTVFDAAMAEVDMDFSAQEVAQKPATRVSDAGPARNTAWQQPSSATEDEPEAADGDERLVAAVGKQSALDAGDDELVVDAAHDEPAHDAEDGELLAAAQYDGPASDEPVPQADNDEPLLHADDDEPLLAVEDDEVVAAVSDTARHEELPDHVETSLEDELNALLGKVSLIQPTAAPVDQAAAEAIEEVDVEDFDWELEAAPQVEGAEAEEEDLHVADEAELEGAAEEASAIEATTPDELLEAVADADERDWEVDPATMDADEEAPLEAAAEVGFDEEDFALTFAEGDDELLPEEDSSRFEDEEPVAAPEPSRRQPFEADEPDPFEALRRMAGSWRASQAAAASAVADKAAEPVTAAEPESEQEAAAEAEPEALAVAAHDDADEVIEEIEDVTLSAAVDEDAAEISDELEEARAAAYDDAPEIETIDVPESAVALADDLDIPELAFEEDERPAAYDDLDAEFANLLNDMNRTDARVSAPQPPVRDDWLDRGRGRAASNAFVAPAAASAVAAGAAYASAAPAAPVAQPAEEAAYGELDLDFDDQAFDAAMANSGQEALSPISEYDPELDEDISIPAASADPEKPARRGLWIAALIGSVAVAGGVGVYALSSGDGAGSGTPALVKADSSPIKVRPENPGGTVVPNQDNKVYESVANKGPAATAAGAGEPKQEKLVTTTEEPLDVAAAEPEVPTGFSADEDGAPLAKGEDRIEQVIDEAENAAAEEVPAVQPRKVRTMVVKPDGSLVPAEMPVFEPADEAAMGDDARPLEPPQSQEQVAAVETSPEPAPPPAAEAAPVTELRASAPVEPVAEAETPVTDEPAPAAVEAAPAAVEPARPPAAAQSSTTPNQVAIAPARPADQPLDIVGEVKPGRVAAVDTQATATTTPTGEWSMQIASQPSQESARSTYEDLAERYGPVLNGRSINIVKAEIPGKGTFWRVRVPAQSRNDAVNLCNQYKAAGGNCFVSK